MLPSLICGCRTTFRSWHILNKRTLHHWNGRNWELLASCHIPKRLLIEARAFVPDFQEFDKLSQADITERNVLLRKALKFPEIALKLSEETDHLSFVMLGDTSEELFTLVARGNGPLSESNKKIPLNHTKIIRKDFAP